MIIQLFDCLKQSNQNNQNNKQRSRRQKKKEIMDYNDQQKPQKESQYIYPIEEQIVQVKSTHLEEYQQFFKAQGINKIDMNQIRKKVKNCHEVKMYEEDECSYNKEGFHIIAIKPTTSSQIYQVSVQMYPFYQKFSVLINQGSSPRNKSTAYSQGSYGFIFLAHDPVTQAPYIIKSLQIKSLDKWQQTLISAVKQYMICSIMSALEVGPKITKQFGFDLVIYESSIQFTMEFCQKQSFKNNYQKQLAINLAIMHAFRIVHLDIKPQNIVFSNFYQKSVFLDFGLSEQISVQIGYMTHTCYVGSFFYSCPEMAKCLQEPGYVDLYFNDVYGLKIYFQYVQKQQKINHRINRSQSCQNLQPYSIEHEKMVNDQKFILFKYFLGQENMEKAQIILSYMYIPDLEQELINFLKSFFPSNDLKQFYYRYIEQKLIKLKNKQEMDTKFKKMSRRIQSNIENELIKQHNKKILSILYEFDQSKNQESFYNKIKLKINLKQILLDKRIFLDFEKQQYISIFFKYVTFQQNKFGATLEDKQKVASHFIRNFKIDEATFLQYEISQPQLKSLVICLKFILDYCEAEPYNEIKIQLYPKVCFEFALVNPDIFTKKHTYNYIKNWYQKISEQNCGNVLKMILNFFKIKQAYKFIWHQSRQINFNQQYQLEFFIKFSIKLREKLINSYELQQKSDDYFVQLLKLLQVSLQISQKITIWPIKKSFLLQKQIIESPKLSNQEKQSLLIKLENQRSLRLQKKIYEVIIIEQTMQKIYTPFKISTLSEELIYLCIYYFKRNDLFNVQQFLNLIDSRINCQLISNRLLTSIRIYLQYFFNRNSAVAKFQQQISQIKDYETINYNFYDEIIKFSSILINQIELKKYTESPQSLKTNKKITIIIKKLTQKMKLVIKNVIRKIKNKDYQLHSYQNALYRLFQYLLSSILYFSCQFQYKRFFYQVFQQFKQEFQQKLRLFPFWKEYKLQISIILIKANKFFEQYKQLQLIFYLAQEIQLKFQKEILKLRQGSNFIVSFLLFVRSYYIFIYNPCNNIQLNIYDSRYNDSYQVFEHWSKPSIKIKIKQLYQQILEQLYLYFVQTMNFNETLKYSSPNYQLFIYLYESKQYQKLIQYIYSYSKFVSDYPNPVTINQLVENIAQLTSKKKKLDKQFLKFYFESKFHSFKVWQNPYWWLVASKIFYWFNKCQRRHLVKIVKSIPYIVFHAKIQIFQTLYINGMNSIKEYEGQQPLIFTIRQDNVKALTTKMHYFIRKHQKHSSLWSYTLSHLSMIKIRKISCKNEYLKYKIFDCIRKKIVTFHKNIGNLFFQQKKQYF